MAKDRCWGSQNKGGKYMVDKDHQMLGVDEPIIVNNADEWNRPCGVTNGI